MNDKESKGTAIKSNPTEADEENGYTIVPMSRRKNDSAKASTTSVHPFKHGVAAKSLRISRTGDVQVCLRAEWPGIFELLPMIGEVLALTNNRSVTLGQFGVFPQLSFCKAGVHAIDEERQLAANVAHLSSVCAKEEIVAGEKILSLELTDISGRAAHKLCLTNQSDGPSFSRLVQQFQADDGAFAEAQPFRFATSVAWCGKIAARREELRASSFAKELKSELLPTIFETALRTGTGLKVTVFTSAIVHSAQLQIQTMSEGSRWLSIMGQSCGLHVDTQAVDELWAVGDVFSHTSQWGIEAFDAHGQLLFCASC